MSSSNDVFRFSPAGFGEDDSEGAEYLAAEAPFVERLRRLYPELAQWNSLAILNAWGAYSQDIFAISHVDWIEERDSGFLAYLYVRAKAPTFNFGGTGLYDKEVWDLGDKEPWLTSAPLPRWAAG